MQKLSESVAPSSRIDAKSINKDEAELTLKENNIDRITHLYVIDDDGVEDVFSNGFRIKNSQEEGCITVILKNIDRKKKFKVAVCGIVRDGDNEKEISLTCDKEIEPNQDVNEALLLSITPPGEKEAKNEGL
uniref:Uncharacterized protein n=1 Tax=Clytia hemisphaerica TaxID=252671 RepID=A0A7M5XEH1_9CNID